MEQVDFEAVKQLQRVVWAEGDFAKIATGAVIVGEQLCDAVDVLPGERVLDVACGSGNTALAAARRFTETVGVDYVPGLLERGRERAAAEGLQVEFVEGDAERLPFDDASFDVVLSTFGAMFAPNQPQAAAELLRVCRPGGRIGMANWTPEGVVGQVFRVTAQHSPPPFPLDPPVLWGTEERLRELFGDGVSELSAPRRELTFRYPSPEFWVEYFRTWFGPTKVVFARLDEPAQEAYAHDLLEVWRRFNRAGDAALVAPGEYLEVVATRA